MVTKTALIRELKAFLGKISSRVKVTDFILFGSRAHGQHRKYSDVDLLVVSPDFRGKAFRRSHDLYDYWKLDLPVDFICLTPEEFKEKSKSRLNVIGVATRTGIRVS